MRLRFLAAVAAVSLVTIAVAAQEPQAARLSASSFDQTDRVDFSLAWRYAPGDDPGRALPTYDDSRWIAVPPALSSTPPTFRWTGVGWFRRHLRVDPSLQSKTLALRFAAPGAARVYLDGRLLLTVGHDAASAEFPSPRSDAVLIRFEGETHVLAVRYAIPARVIEQRGEGLGFLVSMSNEPGSVTAPEDWLVALRGATVALPIFLALLHLGLFSFDRRAHENLFYALEMLVFAVIVLRQYGDVLLPNIAEQQLVSRFGPGLPIAAILFGGLTYYALRTRPWPKSWRALVGAGILLFPFSYLDIPYAGNTWMVYFVALLVEVIRLEVSKRTIRRKGVRFYLHAFAIFGLTIVLQILIDTGVIPSVAGIREIYVVGILVSAVGMSLYLASALGQSRITEAENERKSRELARARDLQLSMLPREMPRVPGLEVAATTQPAAEVGGDYYDARPVGDGSLLVAFGDATGHGLSAGIVVAAAKALFSSLPPEKSPQELLAICDRAMEGMRLPTVRMCLSLALVSPKGISVASAAMPPLLVWRAATGEVEELGNGGLPLGSSMAMRYEEAVTTLAGGDVVLFASDGFAELTDPTGHQLGYEGATDALRRTARGRTAGDLIERLLAEGSAFRSTHPQDDDITFVAVRVATA